MKNAFLRYFVLTATLLLAGCVESDARALVETFFGLALAAGLLTIPAIILGLIWPTRFYPFANASRTKAAIYGIIVLPIVAVSGFLVALLVHDLFHVRNNPSRFTLIGIGFGVGIVLAPVIRSFFSKKKTIKIMGSAAALLILVGVIAVDHSEKKSAVNHSNRQADLKAPQLEEENRQLREQLEAQRQAELRRQQRAENQRVCGSWKCVRLEDGTVLFQTQDGSAWIYRNGKLAPESIWPKRQ